MKSLLYFLPIWILLLPATALAQSSNFEDGFEDGDFTASPAWTGDTGQFTVIDGPPNHLLQLQGDDQNGDVSYLSTASSNVVGSWEFYIELDFSPSGGNRADIFLMSDIADLEGAVDGYALRAGESGSSDVFRIVRYEGGSEAATVLSGTTDISSGGQFRVRVTRETGGEWTLQVAEGYDGQLAPEGGTQTDNNFSSAGYFGVRSTYTSSRANLFYFDFNIDLPPFTTTGADLAGSNTLDIGFNRSIDQGSVTASDFSVDNDLGSPSSVSFPSADTVRLDFGEVIPSNRYTITVSGVSDRSGNTVQAGTREPVIVLGSFAVGDVLINEFVYDPPTGQEEYVELINTSGKYLDLANWELGDDSGMDSFGTGPVVLAADSFLVVSADTSALATVYGARPYFQLDQLAAFNNGGDAIQLTTETGTLADSLSYTRDWGGTDVALERRSVTTSSIYRANWGDSPNAAGGTPGLPNDVPEDTSPPFISGYEIADNQTILLVFSERVNTGSAGNASNYGLNPAIRISSVQVVEPDTVQLALNSPLKNTTDYTLAASSIEDIFGNILSSDDMDFTYYKISQADSGDLFINEFMYDPPNGATEYVELYNPTQQSLDLQHWSLNDNTGSRQTITPSPFVLPPDSSVVIAPDSSLLNKYPHFSLIVMGSDFPSLNNSGDDLIIRRADGTLLDSLRYTSSWGGNEVALERRTTSVAGIYRENWGDAPQNDGSPGRTNNIPADQTAPGLVNYEIRSDTKLRLLFDERVTSASATNTDNYQLSGDISISAANFSAPETVDLQLQSALQNAVSYQLAFGGMADIFGNSLAPQDISFTYYEISEADSGDLFVNEFVYEPPEGSTEYIELYNPTTKSFDLRGWTINDNTGNRRVITHSQFVIPPDSFAVIAPDSTLIEEHPDLNLATTGRRFPSLNNSGDDVVLRSPDGLLMDSLRYTSAWGGNRVSLERKTTVVSSTFRENWADPIKGTGSPGGANSIEPDETAPELLSVNFPNASEIQLAFSETIAPQSATTASNYAISPSRNIQLIAAAQDTINLLLASNLTSGTIYEITVNNLQDIFGNTIGSVSLSREYLLFSQASPGDVVINEVLYERAGATGPEFVELYNGSSKNVNLNGWQFGDGSDLIDIDENIQLEAGGYLYLTGNEGFANTKSNGYHLADFPALNDDEDAVYIRSNRQITIDSLYYYARWGGGEGTSIERKDPAAASNDGSNWITSQSQGGISAGNDNGSFSPDETPPEVIFSTRQPEGLIEVRFDEFIQLTADLSFSLDGSQLQVAAFDSTRANQILLQEPSAKIGKAKSLNITIQNLTDVKGNITSSASISLAEPVEPGSVVINEIMFNPLSESDDNRPDQSEYLELRNTRDYAISLEGFILHDAPDENGEVRSLVPVNSTSKFLPANGHLLVHAEDQTTTFAKSQTAIFFELTGLDLNRTVQIDRGSLSLASQDDAIYLADSTGATIDSVFYDESWHNPNIVDTRGVALERINPSGSSGDPKNWSSSTTEKGGTPGTENSIFQEPQDQPEEIGISFDPNPFSPDGDGREDNLFINYKLDQPDYLLKVRIYDRYGRLVRELADGIQAGFEGSLQWDGLTDEGHRNRIGIYIVLFEAYNSSEGSDRTFKETVVLARQL